MKTDIKDKQLYQEFLAGNPFAFDELMNKYRKQVVCFIQSYVKDFDVAEDLAQDVFVYLLIKRENYDFKYSMKTYLFTIGKSRALNYLKKQKPISLDNDNYINKFATPKSYVEEIYLAEEKKHILFQAIQKLKSNQKIAVYLFDLEGCSHSEVSKVLNKSVSQTKMILYRARRNLKKILEKEDMWND